MKKGEVQNLKVNVISYDEDLDALDLFSDEKTLFCIELNESLIVHLGKRNKVVGIEILNVSSLYDIPKEVLSNIESSNIKTKLYPETKSFCLTIKICSSVCPVKEYSISTTPTKMCLQN